MAFDLVRYDTAGAEIRVLEPIYLRALRAQV
jgi:hypothetical protein